MSLGKKLQGILSLSAASLALFDSAKAKDIIPNSVSSGQGQAITIPTDFTLPSDLVLAPSQEDINKLYAGHRSHSSHSSHRSHSSHYSSSSGSYSTPSYSSPSTPAATPYVPPTPPRTSDPDVARKLLEQKKKWADQGIASYQYEVGMIYLTGKNVPKDESTGRKYIQLSADQNYPQAVTKMSELLGLDVPKAASSTNKSVSTNSAAKSSVLLEAPDSKDPIKDLLQKAGEGSTSAQYELGLRFVKGQGVEKNVEKGKMLLEMAAQKGNTQAAAALETLKEASK